MDLFRKMVARARSWSRNERKNDLKPKARSKLRQDLRRETQEAVDRGLKDAAEGRTKYLGSFGTYSDEDE